MPPGEPFLYRAARWLTFGSAVSIVFSIAISQILLALALAALLLSGERLQLPRIWLPLGLFMLGTVVSLAFSGEAAAGLPQMRKFYVFFELLVVFSCLREAAIIRWMFLTWAGLGSLDAARGFVQFVRKLQQAHALSRNFYDFYVSERITGFMSHWNTFSAQEMFALLMLCAFLFFAPLPRKRVWVWILCAGLMTIALLLAETRAVWIAAAVAGVYLLWFWRRWLAAIVPVAIVLAFFLSPPVIRERFTSLIRPRQVDSNQFRIVTWRTGLRMIEQHPFLGVGPEGVKLHFDDYLPPDVSVAQKPSGWYGHLHNIYLQYAAERGIPTMLILMWLLIQIVVDFWRGLRKLPPGRGFRRFLLQGGIAVWIATMVEGFAEVNLGDTEVLTMFLVVVSCGYLALEKTLALE